MPISSWVITVRPEDERAQTALAQLAADPRVELGERRGDRIPVVLDTATTTEDAALADRIAGLEGVASLLLVHLDFSDIDFFDRGAFDRAAGYAAAPRRSHRPREVQP